MRKEENLLDRAKLLRVLDLLITTALRALVARPRTWVRWAIREEAKSVWDEFGYEDKECSRVVYLLFHANGTLRTEAVEAMKTLAAAVRRCEDAEMVASKTTPDAVAAAAVADAVRTSDERAAEREAKHIAALVKATVRVGDTIFVPAVVATTATTVVPHMAFLGTKVKHVRTYQTDVKPFSSWPTVGEALTYAKDVLVPMEREHGTAWRIQPIVEPGQPRRYNRSRDELWKKYRALASAVGAVMEDGVEGEKKTYDEAVAHVQARLVFLGSHEKLWRALKGESKDADAVLGLVGKKRKIATEAADAV